MDTFVGDGGEATMPHGEGSPSTKGGHQVRAPIGEVVPRPQPREAVSFTHFHKHRLMVLASDFLCGFLHEYGVQLQHLSPNAVSQLVGFIVV